MLKDSRIRVAASPKHRILILLSSLTAEGTPVLALDMAKNWQRRGIDFRVCTFQESHTDLAAEFEAAGIHVDSLSLSFQGYRKFPTLAWRVFQYCSEHQIDSVLSFPFGWHSYVAWGARLAGARRVVAHAGNYPPTHSTGAVKRLRFTLAIGGVWRSSIACCSNHVRDGLARYLRINPDLLQTVYNGVDLCQFEFTARPSSIQVPIRLGMVARFEPHKDQPTLMRAISQLRSRGVMVNVDLVGDGTRRAEFEALAKELDLQDQVRFLGVRRDIPELLRDWDGFVFSVTPDEGLGIALIEALAAGLPVIASDVGACREVLTSETSEILGELFPFGDIDALANAILRFKADPIPWCDRAAKAISSVQHRFSIEGMADKYLRLLGAS
jgi:glycosyltransferase involved in cell wall biosynthesis